MRSSANGNGPPCAGGSCYCGVGGDAARLGEPQLRGSAGGGSACEFGSKGRWRRSAMN
jgi:hypothetical protein